MAELFQSFPHLENEKVIIRKMEEKDVHALSEISYNDNGLAEMFDYKKRANKITIGYRINEKYWNQKIATNVVKLMVDYLLNQIGISLLEAFVMPENVSSSKVLLNNGFVKKEYMVEKNNWGGHEVVEVEVYTFPSECK